MNRTIKSQQCLQLVKFANIQTPWQMSRNPTRRTLVFLSSGYIFVFSIRMLKKIGMTKTVTWSAHLSGVAVAVFEARLETQLWTALISATLWVAAELKLVHFFLQFVVLLWLLAVPVILEDLCFSYKKINLGLFYSSFPSLFVGVCLLPQANNTSSNCPKRSSPSQRRF